MRFVIPAYYQALFYFILIWHPLQGQDYKFKHLSIENGLSQSTVRCIFQDRQGFIWFGTEDGLNRYDGYQFIVYKSEPGNPDALTTGSIWSIFEDHAGRFWIGTQGGGLFLFDRRAEKFLNFRPQPGDSTSLSASVISSIAETSDSLLWIGTWGGGLNCLDLKKLNNDIPKTIAPSLQFKHYRYHSRNIHSLSSNVVLRLHVDPAGHLWIGTQAGLNRYQSESDSFFRYPFKPGDPHSLSHPVITAIHTDKQGILRVGTWGGGLNQLDQSTNRFIHYQTNPADHSTLSNNEIWAIEEDNSGVLWIGTDDGLNTFDRQQKKFSAYHLDPLNRHAIKSNHIRYLYPDDSGILWIGTQDNGINQLNPVTKPFYHLRHHPGQPWGLSNNMVFAIYPDPLANQNRVWIGTDEGIDQFSLIKLTADDSEPDVPVPIYLQSDQHKYLFTKTNHYSNQAFNQKLDNLKKVRVIHRDQKGNLWIGTAGHGLYQFNDKNYTCQHYYKVSDNRNYIDYNYIYAIHEDQDGRLLFGTQGGIAILNHQSQQLTRYSILPEKEISYLVWTIFKDSQNILWIGTGNNGLYKIDQARHEFQNLAHDPQNPTSLSHNTVKCFFEDSAGRLWIGTRGGGLNLFDRQRNQFTHFTKKKGLPSNVIYGILEDTAGNLWMSTNRGVSRFNPQTFAFKNYDISDGLQSNEFNGGSFGQIHGGEFLLFGGVNGFNLFHPANIRDNSYIPQIVITDFKILSLTSNTNNNFLNQNARFLTNTEHFHLLPTDYAVSFEFAALDFSAPAKNHFAYRMEGFDNDWIAVGNHRFVNYTNLPSGNYTFRIKGSNSDGIWNETGTSVRLTVHPPWWATLWAYLFYGLATIALLYGAWRFQLYRIHLSNELKLQKFEAKKLKEIDTMKSRFFANISHEFRTPITLILGPLEKWITKMTDTEAQRDFSLMRRNVQRLHRLINQLLDLSRIEAGKMELHLSTEDLVRLVNHYVQSFESQAKLKEAQLLFESHESRLLAQVDREKIENIIYNLISNALKFTPKNGKITVSVNSASGLNTPPNTPARIEIKVSDTGIGIPTDRLEKIFDRFYQVDDSYVREHEGSGIGLALTKELVELHGGEIFVNSAPGVGSVFTVLLPVGDVQEAAGAGEITADFAPNDADGSEPMLKCPESTPQKDHPLVLIVEDNADLRSYIGEILQPNYRLLEAADGVDGYFQAREKVPDLIISDVMMPKMDGFQLCAKLKTEEITSHIPVILLTARATKASKLEGLETGADDYLIKPFDAEELQVRIKNLITQRRQLRARFSQKLLVEPHEIAVTSADERFLQRALNLIEENMADPEFNAEEFSRRIGLSRSQLHRKLDALTGQSTTEFIRAIRLKRAASLIKQGYGNISEIAFEVGFNHLSYFTECFRKEFGVNPKDYV